MLQGGRVLLLEDELQTRAVVQWLLEQCGAEVAPCAAAAQALNAFRGAPPDRPFHVLVSDIAMPGQDAQARALAGFQTHPAKPVEPQALVATVATLATLGRGDRGAG